MIHKIKRFWTKLVWAYKHVRLSLKTERWDAGYLHDYMIFFLNELKADIEEFEYFSDEQKDEMLKSLNLALKLLIKTNNRYDKFYNLHCMKWGEPKFEFGPLLNGAKEVTIKRRNVKTEEDKKQCDIEFSEAVEKDYRMHDRDFGIALKIIQKYSPTWWT